MLLMLGLLLAVAPVEAQKIQYDCRQCTLTVEDKRKIQKVAEYETAFFAEVFGARRRQTIRVRYYGDEKLFRKGQRMAVGRIISETGLYSPTTKQILIFKWSRFLGTSYHECVHSIYHHHANIRPTWINEGLAEYFKGAVIDSAGNVTIQEVGHRRLAMKKLVSDSSFSIRSTLKASHRKFHRKRHENRNYTTSWGLVYFLRTQHDDIFKLILYHVSAGVKSDKAIEDHYVGGLKQLEQDLVKFYK